MSELLLLVQISVRNLFASFLNIVIGLIILVGTLLFVVGGSLINAMDTSMSRSITGSLAGDAQIYSDKSKDELALYSSWGTPDISAIPDFSKVRGPIAAISNVKTVVPMGVSGASVTFGNTVDLTLERLRKAINAQIAGDKTKELADTIESLQSHVRQILVVIQEDYQKYAAMASEHVTDKENAQALQKAASAAFWADFNQSPLPHLEFLENKIASLVPDADYIYLPYVGTDLDLFKTSFDRMRIVDGEMVPKGQRGLMLSKYVYENQFKLKTAKRLDKIKEAVDDESRTITKDPDLQLMVKQNRQQTRELMLQLDPLTAEKAKIKLSGYLKSSETDLVKLFGAFFETTDANFHERYKFFYTEIAPLVELYRLKPGELLTIKAFTKTGFMQSINLKVYGTYQFDGLEKSGLAGSMSLMDLMSFRDLYGYVTPEKVAEVKMLQERSGAKFVERGNVESELFGGSSSTTVEHAQEKKINDEAEMGAGAKDHPADWLRKRVYTQEEIDGGVALSAAVIMKDTSQLKQTMREIAEVSKANGLNLRVVDWQKAAGNLGQFVFVAKAVLYFAVFIILIVALVIINNAVMMATLQRIREIGTMRAIGAQRTFVLSMVLVETLFLGVAFGTVGTLLGAGIVKWLGKTGIPAQNDFLYFFFSGPRLYPNLGLITLVGAFAIICVVTSISALYPALIATRVSPLQAMQTED